MSTMRTPSPPLADSTAALPPPDSASTPGQAPTNAGRPKRSPKPVASFAAQQAAPRRSPPGSQRRDSSRQTFTTALSYPEPIPQGTVYAADEPEGELKRNQRKSKAQAISKLDRSGTPLSSTAGAGTAGTTFVQRQSSAGPSGPGPSRNPLHRPVVENPPFDPATVRTDAPRHPPSRSGTRLFGLEECPVFYPTMDEFRDPMRYVQSISDKGRQYGMAKVVPPEGWRMPFKLETNTFRFKTRLQRLNSLEAASRAKLNFLEQLTLFHLQQGNTAAEIPVIDRRPVDLWKLRKEVNKVGGLPQVDRMKGWPVIAQTLGYDQLYAEELRTAFNTVIQPFDTFATRAKSQSVSPLSPLPQSTTAKPPGFETGVPPSPSAAARQPSRMSGMRNSPRTRMGSTAGGPTLKFGSESLSPPEGGPLFPSAIKAEPETGSSLRVDSTTPAPSSARISIPGFESRDGTESELSEEELTPLTEPKRYVTPEYQKGEVCEVCRGGEQADKILLCDGCDRGFHTFCLDPPLASVPANEEWYCTPCLLSQGDDYGFEEGEEHSIPSFQTRDAAFSHAWFNKHRPHSHAPRDELNRTFGKCVVSEDDVEREFWRLTESTSDTVEVEYGADVHSTTHGSAAPTMETFPEDEYSLDGWNLNNMPILPDSLLRYIKSDISGMTVPWIYLGMLFSAFCWHNEDHYTYSINYMFWGETKTWYGIAGDDADKFEAAIKSEAPELFEAQPGLLFQLVTMMNPGRLKEAGVKVVACDQRPNEFVVTWPKAYHCGFNHGINFNEAVNFALPDWLDDGRESVRRYAEHLKPPVFSHNELLVTVSLFSDSIKSALWLQSSLKDMIEEETRRRDKLRADVPMLHEILNEEDVPEDQYQCAVCKAFCYLSQVVCSCTKAVTCIEHADQLCSCTKSKRSLRKRYSESQLEEILNTVSARAAQPQAWRERLEALAEVPRPKLKTMRGLLTDGERIALDMEEVEDLREMVGRAQAWVDKAVAMFTRKSTGRRRKGRQEAETEDLDRSVEAFQALFKEVELLAFDAPEILQLRQTMLAIDNFRTEATMIFRTAEAELDLARCKTVLILGQGLPIEMPEVAQIEQIVKRLDWFHKVNEEVDDRTMSLGDVTDLIEEAKASGISASHSDVLELVSRQKRGQDWLRAVESLPAAVTIEQVEALMAVDPLVPLHTPLMDKLEAMRNAMEGWKLTAARQLSGAGTPVVAARLCKDVKASDGLLRKAIVPEVDLLQAELDFHEQWILQLRELLAADNKLLEGLKYSLKQFKDNLQEDDMEPNSSHACFCRVAPAAVMVKCQSCNGDYHPKCVSVSPKNINAMTSFVCDICLPASEDDRPSLSKLAWLADAHKWDFIFPPVELAVVKSIVDISVPYARHIYQLADPFGEARSRDFDLLAHHARKMFQLSFSLDAINHKTGERVVFEQWIYKRMNDVRLASASQVDKDRGPPRAKPKPRTREPRFVIKEARNKKGDFKCLCEGKEPGVSHEGAFDIGCKKCGQHYWSTCVYAVERDTKRGTPWRCPICHVREGKEYRRQDGSLIADVKLIDDGHWSAGKGRMVDYAETIRENRLIHSVQPDTKPFESTDSHVIELHLDRFVPGDEREHTATHDVQAQTVVDDQTDGLDDLHRKRKAEGEVNGDAERRVLPKLDAHATSNGTHGFAAIKHEGEANYPPPYVNGHAGSNGTYQHANGPTAPPARANPTVPANYVPLLPQHHSPANGTTHSTPALSNVAASQAAQTLLNGFSTQTNGHYEQSAPLENGHSDRPGANGHIGVQV